MNPLDSSRWDGATRLVDDLAAQRDEYEQALVYALVEIGELRVYQGEAEERVETHVLCREEIAGGVVWKLMKRSMEQLP